MVKATYDAVSVAIPTKELISAAKKFLLHSDADKDLILEDNIDSPKFGSSDLLFVNKAKTSLTIVRWNHDEEEREKFVISSISYYLWLREFMTASEIFFNAKSGLEMYVFSRDFSAAACHMMEYLSKKIGVHLVRYSILEVEHVDEPGIYFQHLTLKDTADDKHVKAHGQDEQTQLTRDRQRWASLRISSEELREFERLKKLHLA